MSNETPNAASPMKPVKPSDVQQTSPKKQMAQDASWNKYLFAKTIGNKTHPLIPDQSNSPDLRSDVNPIKGKAYQGEQALILMSIRADKGYKSNLWITKEQLDFINNRLESEGQETFKLKENDQKRSWINTVFSKPIQTREGGVIFDMSRASFGLLNLDQIDGTERGCRISRFYEFVKLQSVILL
ncbi:MAG: ArdC family protein [Treponema sp.]|nr:ArdC family protein [Treponema sp.]